MGVLPHRLLLLALIAVTAAVPTLLNDARTNLSDAALLDRASVDLGHLEAVDGAENIPWLRGFREFVWTFRSDANAVGRCTVSNVPCATECVTPPVLPITPEFSTSAGNISFSVMPAFCLTHLGTVGKCKRDGETCFQIVPSAECIPTHEVSTVACDQEGETDFLHVQLTSTLMLPILPSKTTQFIGDVAATPIKSNPRLESYTGPLAKLFKQCIAKICQVTENMVDITMIVPQREGIVAGVSVVVDLPEHVAATHQAFQNSLKFGGRMLTQTCASIGMSDLIGASVSTLAPVTMTYGGDLKYLVVERFTISPPHLVLHQNHPRTNDRTEIYLKIIVKLGNEPLDTMKIRDSFGKIRQKRDEFRGKKTLLIMNSGCIAVTGEPRYDLPECKRYSFAPQAVQALPYARRRGQLNVRLSNEEVENIREICGTNSCLLQIPSGILEDTGGRTNLFVIVSESLPITVDWWSITAESPPYDKDRPVRVSVRIKFSTNVDIATFDSRRFAIGERHTASRLKQILGHNITAAYVQNHDGEIRRDFIQVRLPEPDAAAAVQMIRSIREHQERGYLVVADRGIQNLGGTQYIDAYGPIDESDDCWDKLYPYPTVEVDAKTYPVNFCAKADSDPTSEESEDCGKLAADNFCRYSGHSHSFFFGPSEPSKILDPLSGSPVSPIDSSLSSASGICNSGDLEENFQTSCRTFSSITCCADSGGTVVMPPPTMCLDFPKDWIDSSGDSCAAYDKFRWKCEIAESLAFKGEKSAKEACCVCQGGDPNGKIPPVLIAWTFNGQDGFVLYFSQDVDLNDSGMDSTGIHVQPTRDSPDMKLPPNLSFQKLSSSALSIRTPETALISKQRVDQYLLQGRGPPTSMSPLPLMWLWTAPFFVKSGSGQGSIGDVDDPVQQLSELVFENLGVSILDDQGETTKGATDGEEQKLPENPDHVEVVEIRLTFNRNVIPVTLNLSKVRISSVRPESDDEEVLQGRLENLSGGRILRATEASRTVYILFQKKHKVTELVKKAFEASADNPDESPIYAFMDTAAIRESKIGILSSRTSARAAKGCDRQAKPEGKVEGNSGDGAFEFEKMQVIFNDAEGHPSRSDEFTEVTVGTMRMFVLKSSTIARLTAVSVFFSGGEAFINLAHFRFGDGWTYYDQSNTNLDPKLFEKSEKVEGSVTKKGPFASPHDVRARVLLNDGANIFRLEMSKSDPSGSAPVETHYFGLVIVKDCGASDFPEPTHLLNGKKLRIGGEKLLEDAQQIANDFCRYQRKVNRGSCGGDYLRALPKYVPDSTINNWRVSAVADVTTSLETKKWCGATQVIDNHVCVSGRPKKLECSPNPDVKQEYSLERQWCAMQETARITGNVQEQRSDYPQCCFEFSKIECDTLRASSIELNDPLSGPLKLTSPYRALVQGSKDPTGGNGPTPPGNSGLPPTFEVDNFILLFDKSELKGSRIRIFGEPNSEEFSVQESSSKNPPNKQGPTEEINDLLKRSVHCTAEFPGGLRAIPVPAKPGDVGAEKAIIEIVRLMNVVLVQVVEGSSKVQYAIVLTGKGDNIGEGRRKLFRLMDITGEIDRGARNGGITKVPWNQCEQDSSSETCGQMGADSFCRRSMGSEWYAESFTGDHPVDQAVDSRGTHCLTHFSSVLKSTKQCFTFSLVTCSNFPKN